jgi:hypothetical protein
LVETLAQAITFLKILLLKTKKLRKAVARVLEACEKKSCLVLVYFFLSSVSQRGRCVANRQFNQTQRHRLETLLEH